MAARSEPPIARTARLAGGLYLALLPFGLFSFVYVPSVLMVRGDPATTVRNLMAAERLFRCATVSHLISQIVVVFLALAMHRLLRPVHENHTVLMVVLALLGIPIACLDEVNNLAALRLLASADDGAFTPNQLQAQAMLFLDMGRSGVLIAQVFWGLWLLVLGSLVFRSGFLPRVLGIAGGIAGAGYLIDSAAHLLCPGLATISQFTALGELLLPVWLLVKGVNLARWQQVAGAQGT